MIIIIELENELTYLAKASATIVTETGAELKAISSFYIDALLANLVDCGEDFGDIVSAIEQFEDSVCSDLDSVGGVGANLDTAQAVGEIAIKIAEELLDAGFRIEDFARMKLQGWCDKFSPIIEVL